MGPQDVRPASVIPRSVRREAPGEPDRDPESARRLAYVYSATAGFSVVREFLIEGGQPDGLGAGLGLDPKCSTKAPGAYENPELLAYGGQLNPGPVVR